MMLTKKSDDNIFIVDYLYNKKEFRSGLISRLYYATFQILKHYLLQAKFDYQKFLIQISKPSERHFSHGTIGKAILEMLKMKSIVIDKELEILIERDFDRLYVSRRTDDYDDKKMFNQTDLLKLSVIAKNIINKVSIICVEAGL